jgi:hypothetical protein
LDAELQQPTRQRTRAGYVRGVIFAVLANVDQCERRTRLLDVAQLERCDGQQLSNFSLANGMTRLVFRSKRKRGRSTRSLP